MIQPIFTTPTAAYFYSESKVKCILFWLLRLPNLLLLGTSLRGTRVQIGVCVTGILSPAVLEASVKQLIGYGRGVRPITLSDTDFSDAQAIELSGDQKHLQGVLFNEGVYRQGSIENTYQHRE